MKFSADGNFLYTGARKDPDILCWDIRYTSDVVYRLQRDTGDTNQRIQFDIEPMGRHLATGQSVFVASPVSHHLAAVRGFLACQLANMWRRADAALSALITSGHLVVTYATQAKDHQESAVLVVHFSLSQQ